MPSLASRLGRAAGFPWIDPARAVVLLRLCVALIFIAHAAVRVANGTIPRFGAFLESQGLPFGIPLVWLVTATELGSGALLIAGRAVRLGAALLFGVVTLGIPLVHVRNGWFVGEHGTGGMEYSVALMVALLVIAASGPGSRPGAVEAGPG